MSESLDPGLNETIAALAALAPHPTALNRDRLLFDAGRASAPRPWFWRLSTAASTTLAAFLAVVLFLRPAPTLVQVVFVHDQPPSPPAPKKDDAPPPKPAESEPPAPPYSWPTTPYTRLEDKVLRWGLDGLAEPTPPAAPPDTLDSLLRSL